MVKATYHVTTQNESLQYYRRKHLVMLTSVLQLDKKVLKNCMFNLFLYIVLFRFLTLFVKFYFNSTNAPSRHPTYIDINEISFCKRCFRI